VYYGWGRIGLGVCGSEEFDNFRLGMEKCFLLTLPLLDFFFFFYRSWGVLKLGLDSYASFAILFYVLGGLAYAFWISEDVTGIGGGCVCAEE